MFLTRFKFTFRAGIGLGLFFAAIVIAIVVSINSIRDAQQNLERVMNNINVKIAVVESMVEMIKNVEIYTRNIVLITDVRVMQEEMNKLLVARNIYDESEARLEKIFVTSEDHAQLAKIRELRAKARPMVNHAIELGLQNKDADAIPYLMREVVPVTEKRLEALSQFIKQQREIRTRVAEEISSAHARASFLIIMLGALALFLGILVAIIFMPFAVGVDVLDADRLE